MLLQKFRTDPLDHVTEKYIGGYMWFAENSCAEDVPSRTVTLDDVLDKTIGQFGRWQFRMSLFMSLLKFPIAWLHLGIVFLAPPTKFWCRRPPDYVNVSVSQWLPMILPNMTHQNTQLSLVHGSCFIRDPFSYSSGRSDDEPLIKCPWGYEFNTSEVHTSIITDWQLVCGRERLVDVAQSTFMFGVLLGNLIFGYASDRYGRKPMLMVCLAVQAVGAFVTALVPNFELFLLARFITAFANGGTMVTSFVMCMEIVGGKWRTIVPILYQIPFGTGNTVLAGLAYLLRDWRNLQLAIACLCSLFLIYIRYVPESPRWLLATGRKEDALNILEAAAAENKRKTNDVRDLINTVSVPSEVSSGNKQPILTGLWRVPILRKRTAILCLQWFIVGVTFYGFSQYMGQVSVYLYLTVAIGGLIALPGTLLCCVVVRRYGRRVSIAAAHIFTALCYLAIMAVPLEVYAGDWPRVVLAALGVIGISISMPALYLFTGELYPTVLRNAGVGASVMCSRLGSMLAPFVTSLSGVVPWLPLLVLGTLVLLEAFLVLPLSETKDMALPDTIQDAMAMKEKSSKDDKDNGNYIFVAGNDA